MEHRPIDRDDRFQRIVSLAADAIICVDKSQRITFFNEGAERTFGYTKREILGQSLELLIPERFRHSHGKHVRDFAEKPPVARHMGDRQAIFARRKNGEEFPAEATISKISIADDDILTVVLRDITAQKLVESELQRRVAERTADLEEALRQQALAQEKLLRSQRMEAYGQLTGGVAHDFNNLLTVIGGNLELLQDRLADERSKKLLGRALNAVEMGSRLTQRLLAFARRSRLEPRLLDMNELVGSLVDMTRRTIGESISVTANLAEDLWPVRADASEIENAILNLAINSRDAMPEGGHISIETTNATLDETFARMAQIEATKPGDYVRLSVSDTGCGMTEEVLAHAFEPFFTTKEPGRGTGLGLASIYGFARQSGGYVTIYSEVGKGTSVNLYLPRADDGTPRAKATAPEAAQQNGQGVVLVVEDNEGVREVTVERLETLGYRVIACNDAGAARKILLDVPEIDLVFSDVVMPGGMSGIDLAHWLKKTKPATRMLLTSGFSDEVARIGSEGTTVRILTKPYALSELSRAIREALGR